MSGPWLEVVGVVEDVYSDGLDQPAPSTIYVRAGVVPAERPGGVGSVGRGVTFAIRSERAGSPAFVRELSAAVQAVNASLPLAKVSTLGELYRSSTARTSFALVLLVIAGFLSLALAIAGLYGVLSYAVVQRRHEIGIRVALGSDPGRIQALFVRQGLVLACIGVAIGLVCAAGFSELIRSLLFGVSPLDPITFSISGGIVIVAAVLASYVPAWNAASVDPLESLRSD